jgi:hypothetical protein
VPAASSALKPGPLKRAHRDRRLGKGNGRGSAPILTRDQAQAAVLRAREVGIKATAAELGVSQPCLHNTWRRFGIKGPGQPQRFIPHPAARALTREQAEAAIHRALQIGLDATAAELHVHPRTVQTTWRRYGIKGPGKGHAAVIREARRRASRASTMEVAA